MHSKMLTIVLELKIKITANKFTLFKSGNAIDHDYTYLISKGENTSKKSWSNSPTQSMHQHSSKIRSTIHSKTSTVVSELKTRIS